MTELNRAARSDSDERAGQVPVLKTKLHRPPVAPGVLPRDRLLDQLNEGFHRPLTLISAPAGYGKSTLAGRWLASCDSPSAWISLDERDNDLWGFLTYLLAALDQIFPGCVPQTQMLMEAPRLPPASVLGTTLINELDELDKRFILVLDDYHKIRDPEIHNLLTDLLAHPPPAVHLVLLTRRDPPLSLHRLRASSQMTEIVMEQLRFSVPETEAFLQKTLGGAVDTKIAALLQEKTEGWVTGLHLAALSLRNQEDLHRTLSKLKGGFYNVSQYLANEVLSQQTPELARYLMETSILDRFCAPLCERIHAETKNDGSLTSGEEFVEWLDKANLFVIPLDLEHCWFRYHHLFQELLQHQLERRSAPEEVERLHARASDWFLDNDLVDEAIQHALKAGDVAGAAEIVDQHRYAELDADRWHLVERWLSRFTEEVVQKHPGLLMARAWALYHKLDMPALPSVIDAAESLLDDSSSWQLIRGEICSFRGYICYFRNEAMQSLKHLQDARKMVPDTRHEIRYRFPVLEGLAAQMLGGKDEAVGRLHHLLNDETPGESRSRTRYLITLAYIHIISGELDQAFVANQRLSSLATQGHYQYVWTWSRYLRGLIDFYRNDLKSAVDYFGQAVEMRYILKARAVLDSMAGLAYSYQAMGQPDQSNSTIQLLSEYTASLNDPAYSTLVRSCRTRLSIMSGEWEPAANRLSESPTPVENMVWWLEIPDLTYCRALLAEGTGKNLAEAEKRLLALLQMNEDNHNALQTTVTLTLLALCFKRQERHDDAMQTLSRCCALVKPDGCIQPFVEAGPLMAEMLALFVKETTEGGVASRVLAALAASEGPVTSGLPTQHALEQAGLEALTNRELDILELLVQRLQNKEIADQLCISSHTVSYHLKHIYEKLDVHGRRQAVTRATELGIL